MGIARVTIKGRVYGQTTNNVIHFRKDDAISSDYPILLNYVRDAWCVNPFQLNTDANYQVESLHLYHVGSSDVPLDMPLALSGVYGPVVNATPLVAAVFQIRTAIGGRRGRGRWYQAGFLGNSMDKGNWSTATMVALNACAAQIKNMWVAPTGAVYTLTGWRLVVCPRNDPTASIDATNIVARSMVGYIGKRQLSRGE
jgi:hypothetical protein